MPDTLTLLTQAAESAKFLQEENEALKAELAKARERAALLDEFKAFMEAKSTGTTTTVSMELGSYSPLEMKRERRAALNAYLKADKHLTQANKTIAKKFGMSQSNVATIISEMSRAGEIKTRPRGRPSEAEGVAA